MRYQPVNQRIRIQIVQVGGLLLAAVLLLTHPALGGEFHEILEFLGFGFVLACVAGRMWSILYIGSKKNAELVTSGPYSITRNPLYFFSTLGAIGVGLIHGSVIVALALGFLTYAVLVITAGKEAEHLRTIFGSAYDTYAIRTPMFWPRLTLYQDHQEVTFSPKALRRTFYDGLFFLASFPLIEGIEKLQIDGLLPVLMKLV